MESTSLEDLIMMAGGLTESASASRAEVARRYRATKEGELSGVLSEIFQFAVDKDLGLSEDAGEFTLQPFDQVFIRKSPGYEEPQVVSVEGEVLYPGEYSLSTKVERISDIVTRAGGLTPEAYPEGASLLRKVSIDREERRKALESLMQESGDSLLFTVDDESVQAIGINLTKIMENPGSKYDLFLQEGDQLKITKEAQTVRLSGALLYPITVRYDKSFSFNKYISMAGGFASDAKKSKSYVIYANGSIDKTNKILFCNNYPKVAPGAEIVVPRKPERTKMSTQEVVGLSSAVSSMALIIVTIINNFDGGSGN
jgi:protein involved in polysaccharide export with SLBB domain